MGGTVFSFFFSSFFVNLPLFLSREQDRGARLGLVSVFIHDNAGVSTDVQTVGPSSVFVLRHQKGLKEGPAAAR